ncbi:MAG: heavy metal-associated domain-containing protein, partial [Bacteroidota bacterium]
MAPDPDLTAPPEASGAAETHTLRVEGMTCASCVARVERVLARADGVEAASVNLATERATVRARGVAEADLVARIEKAGFGAAPLADDSDRGESGGAQRAVPLR